MRAFVSHSVSRRPRASHNISQRLSLSTTSSSNSPCSFDHPILPDHPQVASKMPREGTRSATGNSRPRVFPTVDTAPAIKRTTKPKAKKPAVESTAKPVKPTGVTKKVAPKKDGAAAKVNCLSPTSSLLFHSHVGTPSWPHAWIRQRNICISYSACFPSILISTVCRVASCCSLHHSRMYRDLDLLQHTPHHLRLKLRRHVQIITWTR